MKRSILSTSSLFLVLMGTVLRAPASQAEATPLRVCMDEKLPPYSVAKDESGSGFDVALAQALAKHLGRPLEIQWYETKFDEESSPTLESNALLSDGRCDLMAGYPLVVDTLGKPGTPSARLPDFHGAKPADRRRRVELGTLVPSAPYQRAPLAMLFGPRVSPRQIKGLADVTDLRFGVEGGSFADAILMLYQNGRLVPQITHFAPGGGQVLVKLESGDIDATFLSLARFDAYRLEHPDTQIRDSGFNYPVAFNLGYAALSSQGELIAKINTVLAAMRASGEIAEIAKRSGVTYVAPIDPAVSPGISFAQLEH